MIFFLFLSLPLATFAQEYSFPATFIPSQENCSQVDVTKVHPRIKNNSKLQEHFKTPRNQDSIGWCYAFVAADLVSIETGNPVSSLHASTIYNRELYKSPSERYRYESNMKLDPDGYREVFEGGRIQTAVDLIIKEDWICSEKGLPFDRDKYKQIDNLIKDLEEAKRNTNHMVYVPDYICNEVNSILKPFKLLTSQVDEVVVSMLSDNLNITMDLFSRHACTEKIKNKPKITMKHLPKPSPGDVLGVKDYMTKLNTLLEHGKPVAIDYSLEGITASGGGHGSLIMGRRWNNGRCEYKIRNSWGKSCGSYLPGIECEKSEGAYWLNAEKLFTASNHLFYNSN